MSREELYSKKQLKNLRYFDDNLEDFLNNDLLKGKYVVIHDEKVKGSFDDFGLAIQFALEHFSQDEFVIQQVINNKEIVNFIKSAV